jgi:endonuclease/exonuclease/phosphatase (EEP) superfamily protein YafD
VFDPYHKVNQTPQNVEITFRIGENKDAVIFGGDFNTRMHAPFFGDKGNPG